MIENSYLLIIKHNDVSWAKSMDRWMIFHRRISSLRMLNPWYQRSGPPKGGQLLLRSQQVSPPTIQGVGPIVIISTTGTLAIPLSKWGAPPVPVRVPETCHPSKLQILRRVWSSSVILQDVHRDANARSFLHLRAPMRRSLTGSSRA